MLMNKMPPMRIRLLLDFKELGFGTRKVVLRKVSYEQNALALVCNDLHGNHVGTFVFTGKTGD